MTVLLESAIEQASKLPAEEQDRLAVLLLEHIGTEKERHQRPPQAQIDAAVEGISALQKQFRLDGLHLKDMIEEGRAA